MALATLVLSGILISSAGQAQHVNHNIPRDSKGTVVTKEPVVFVKDKNTKQEAPVARKAFPTYKLKARVRPCSFGPVYTY